MAVWLAVMMVPAAAAAEDAVAPTLDCTLGFEGIRAAVKALPGTTVVSEAAGRETVTVSDAGTWSAQIAFTTASDAAHPAVTLRTLRKQVTGVWTADSKACGFGNALAFDALMADMKAGDTEITNASRAEVERTRQGQSPLGQPAP